MKDYPLKPKKSQCRTHGKSIFKGLAVHHWTKDGSACQLRCASTMLLHRLQVMADLDPRVHIKLGCEFGCVVHYDYHKCSDLRLACFDLVRNIRQKPGLSGFGGRP